MSEWTTILAHVNPETLAKILRDWLGEGFQVEGEEVDLATRLLDELEARQLVAPDPWGRP